jgi:hypothetical protein
LKRSRRTRSKRKGTTDAARQRKINIANSMAECRKKKLEKALANIRPPLAGEVYLHLPPDAMDMPYDELVNTNMWAKAVKKHYAVTKRKLRRQCMSG